MSPFLFKLLHAPVSETSRLVHASVVARGIIGFGWVVALALLLGAGVVWMYRLTAADVSPWRKYTMAALRALFLFFVALLLVRPVLVLTVEGSVRRSLIVLLDATTSMNIKDSRTEEADLKRAALAKDVLDPRRGLGQPLDKSQFHALDQIPRLDLLKATLKNERLHLLAELEKEYDLAPFTFGQRLAEPTIAETNVVVAADTEPKPKPKSPPKPPAKKTPQEIEAERHAWIDRLDATSPSTAIGDGIREVISRKRGQPLAGIFLITDGSNNSGSSPLDAALVASMEAAPLYIYGIGITSPKDISVVNLFADEVVFVKDEVPITVRVRSQGMGGRRAPLLLRLGLDKVTEKEIQFAGDGEQVVAMQFTPQTPGEYDLKALIEPLEDEVFRDNNSFTKHIRVVDSKIKVLYVEQSPRWEFRYLQAMLMRDRRVDLKCVLLEGDPQITRGENSPYLDKFPTDKSELFKYDLVIVGDVDPRTFSAAQLDNLGEFVAKFGGAFLMIAGRRFSPWAYHKTPIEKMLPVEFEPFIIETGGSGAETPIQLDLTAAGKSSVMMRLSDKEEESNAIWKRLPPVYWTAKVSRAKPAAEVLLVDADPLKASRFGKMPVMASQQYGLGQVMFVGSDNFWRWRRNVGDRYYTMLWGQLTQRLALPHLLGGSKRTQLSTDRQNYMTGERISVYARLYSANFQALTESQVKGFYTLKNATDAAPQPVQLRAMPEQPGMYRGEFVAPVPGSYKFSVEQDAKTQLDFSVVEPKFELGDTAMNETLLKQMAKVSGGEFYREEDIFNLPNAIRQKSVRVRSDIEVELWSSPLYFLLMLLIVTAEWILRKLSQLK